MKKVLFINDSLANKITYYHLLFFLVALPFDMFYSELVLASLLVHTIIHFRKQDIPKKLYFCMFPAFIYLLTAISTLYSFNKPQAFFEWQKQLALLIFPLIISATSLDLEKYRMQLLQAFSFTCTLIVVYLFIDAIQIINYNKLPFSILFTESFTNHNFPSPINLHATYFSAYIAVSFITSLYYCFHSEKKAQMTANIISCLILFAGLIQLLALSVFMSLFIILLIFPFFVLRQQKRKIFFLVFGIFSVCFLSFALKTELFKDRLLLKFKQDLTTTKSATAISDPRGARWNCATELIAQKPVTGYGSGTETELLKEKYFEKKLYNSYLYELNAHNEYLSLLIKNGIPGLVVYLFILFIGFKLAIQAKDIFFCSFLVLITIISLTENILDVNKGIFFFAFFFSVLAGKQTIVIRLAKVRLNLLRNYEKISE
ncbi:MAG: O-antigen ligase family protein [Bacteroidetes bacterium]|nr:O-antigen ligase family protein [Bacteroidota bacterium]